MVWLQTAFVSSYFSYDLPTLQTHFLTLGTWRTDTRAHTHTHTHLLIQTQLLPLSHKHLQHTPQVDVPAAEKCHLLVDASELPVLPSHETTGMASETQREREREAETDRKKERERDRKREREIKRNRTRQREQDRVGERLGVR